jgi:RNA polymerase sigma-70 factor (ECF subfamily)
MPPEKTSVDREETSPPGLPPARNLRSANARLVDQLRRGDADAGREFVAQHYPGIYRYLLRLTGCPETAEDLTQAGEARFGASGSERQHRGPGPGFLQAWRRLETFDDRAPFGPWLHRIAYREFLQALRSQRPQTSLEDVTELSEVGAASWTELMALREVIRKLPVEEGEVVMLHYLQGHNCQEIAHIIRAPVTTVKYRLSMARFHLQRELGEGDLIYLNGPGAATLPWVRRPLDPTSSAETRLPGSDRWAHRVACAGAPTGSAAEGGTDEGSAKRKAQSSERGRDGTRAPLLLPLSQALSFAL